MDTTKHLSICMLITNLFLQINNRVDMYIHKFIIYKIKLQHIWLHISLLCSTVADKDVLVTVIALNFTSMLNFTRYLYKLQE